MARRPDPLTVELLAWIAGRPRSYADAMDAWRSNCPRHTVWEDAVEVGFVKVVRNGGRSSTPEVVLTERGRAALG